MESPKTAVIKELRTNLQGEVLLPGDDAYSEARTIWNAMIDRRPGLIARCQTTEDVEQAVNFARENNLAIAIHGGGHNVAGNAVVDDGVMIDLSPMRTVEVDEQGGTVRVGGGCLWSDVDHETQRFGLAAPAGIISHTGVAGLTLGGGFGWISRAHGLTVDNLLEATVVTADGRIVTASAEENPDLFWGLRGGGGNFGIVTSFLFRCAKIGTEVYAGLIVKKFENAKAVLQFWRDYARTMPDEMTIWTVVRHAPPLPFLPESVHGTMVVIVPFVWLGDQAKGEELIKPIREATESVGEHIGMVPWVDWQAGFDGLVTHGARNYWKSHHLASLPDDAIDTILDFAGRMPTDECEVFMPHMEGKPSRVDANATAYPHRTPPFVLNVHTRWQDAESDEANIAWARDFAEATQQYAQGVYVNFISQEGEDRVKQAYTPEVWERLVEVKDKWDPNNIFRMNQNIKPSV